MGVDELFKIIIYIAGGFVAIGGGSAIVIKVIKYFLSLNQIKEKVERGAKLDDLYELDHQLIEEISKHNKEQDIMLENNSNGLQALLRNELVSLYREYIELREIRIIELDNIEHMYQEYKNLGGNGAIDKLIKDLRKLPIK